MSEQIDEGQARLVAQRREQARQDALREQAEQDEWAQRIETARREQSLGEGIDPDSGERFAEPGQAAVVGEQGRQVQDPAAVRALAQHLVGDQLVGMTHREAEEAEVDRSTQDLYATVAPVMGQSIAVEAVQSRPRADARFDRLQALSARIQGGGPLQFQDESLPTGAQFDRLRSLCSQIRHQGTDTQIQR